MSAMDRLLNAVNKAKSGGQSEREEDYFYYPARDAAGNGSAVVRFLPGTTPDDMPFVKLYTHGFQGPSGKWLIDNCLTTIEKDCPVCAANSQNYATMTKEEARKKGMNRKTSYISRVLVVEDKKNPDNEGKVFLFKYGTKVFDKIADALNPVDEDDTKFNVFGLEDDKSPWPVFKYKIRKVDGQTNYDKSTFEKDDTDVDVNFKKQFTADNDINKFIAPEKFKSAEKLQERLDFVLGNAAQIKASKPKVEDDEDEEFESVKTTKQDKTTTKRVEVSKSDDDDDDILNLVKSLTNDE